MPAVLLCASAVATAYAQPETPRQSLNQYVAFLNGPVRPVQSRKSPVLPADSAGVPPTPPVSAAPEPPAAVTQLSTETLPFPDEPLVPFTLKRTAAPATPALPAVLNAYVGFINESLRQLHELPIRSPFRKFFGKIQDETYYLSSAIRSIRLLEVSGGS